MKATHLSAIFYKSLIILPSSPSQAPPSKSGKGLTGDSEGFFYCHLTVTGPIRWIAL